MLSLLKDLGPFYLKSFNKCCDSCHHAKQARSSFPVSAIKTDETFELIHYDVWGPYQTPSVSGAHYFLSIVDDYTKITWVYLMQAKSEVYTRLVFFMAMTVRQSGKTVKTIRSDNGTEFTNHNLHLNCQQHGIVTQFSHVSTPQQNGVVEHKHRHILDVARALRFQTNLPIKFWGECILNVVYLINYTPTPFLSGQSPYEFLFSCKPNYSHLRVFGCLCYASVLPRSKDKFS